MPSVCIVFFAKRDAHNARRLLTETPLDRQACLNRERKPPTVSAKVFVWEPSEANPNEWMRLPVRKADRKQTLDMYSGKMAWYDSFTNEWDCCGEFGPPEAMDEDFGSPLPEAGHQDSLDDPTQEPLMPFQDVGPRLLTPPTQPEQTRDAECYTIPRFVPLGRPVEASLPTQGPSTEADLWQQEVLEILVVYYGYTPPLPLPADIAPTISLVDQKKMVRLLGLSWAHSEPFASSSATVLAKSYLDKIITNVRPSDDQCDLNTSSRLSVATSRRFPYLRVVSTLGPSPKPLYMFDFGDISRVPWKLTMTSASDALMVCRLDASLSEYEVATYLLQRGIPFKTLLPARLAQETPMGPPPPCVLGARLSVTKFSTKDYDSYSNLRTMIVQQPRSCAALLCGGIIWRLCCDTISYDTVLEGPTGWSTVPDANFLARDPKTNQDFVNDALTDVKLSFTSGAYTCYTGIPTSHIHPLFKCKGNQTAIRFWHPPIATFDAGGENYGHWTPYREDGFMRWLDKINNLKHSESSRGPLTTSKWRDLTRGMKESQLIKENLESWSREFINLK
ncbi:hypothetical protein DXG01_006267 [Tephrocybe rancida]|nr:hypothetical protein DXG01_006267 [Tephrocybe rancida]